MKCILVVVTVCLALTLAGPAVADDAYWYASVVDSYALLGGAPYDLASASLGKPTLKYKDIGMIFSSSLVAAPCWVGAGGEKIITTVATGGYLVVKFADPIEDDPANWDQKDFIVFGNAAFNGHGDDPEGYLTSTTDLETYRIDPGGSGRWEPTTVSVAQYATGPWYTYSSGPYADDFAPTQAYGWDYVNHAFGPEMDFTKPVDMTIPKSAFGELSAAAGIDLYKGSGGGTAFDLNSSLLSDPIPVNASGRKWIQYIRFTGRGGEVDAVSRVGHAVAPVTIAQAKLLSDGTPVIVTPQIVSAGTGELGDCCYVESEDRSCGIRVAGRVLDRGKLVTIYGVMATRNGEREIRTTAAEVGVDTSVAPLGMPNAAIGGVGLNNTGLLVRAWGEVKSVDAEHRTFVIDDGSGRAVKCVAPADELFELPVAESFVRVTGVVSREQEASGIVPVIRIRVQADVNWSGCATTQSGQ